MIEVRSMSVTYPGPAPLEAVQRVSLEIPQGGAVGLVGESGSGKSTFAKALVGIEKVSAGKILYEGRDVTNLSPGKMRSLRDDIQMVFQDPSASLNPRMRVGEAIAEAVAVRERRRVSRKDADEVVELLESVGLSGDLAGRYPYQLSGGQKQRVALSRALARKPKVLLLDEVTASLDVSVQASVLNLLRKLRAELNLTFLVIAHDLAIVRYLCDEVAVMQLGLILEKKKSEDLFSAPEHPYTKALIDAVPQFGRRTSDAPPPLTGEIPDPLHRPQGCVFSSRCPVGPMVRDDREICLQVRPSLEPASGSGEVACHFPLSHPGHQAST